MKISKNHTVIRAALVAGILSLALNAPAFSEDAPEKAQALLDKVKQGELDRQIAAKQTEIDRLKEDLDKGKKDAQGLQQTMEATNALITESTENLDKLTAERKRLEQAFNLALARISAERQKIDGLRNLSDAQGKSLGALMKQIEETDVRSRVRAAEMQLLTEGKPVPTEGSEDKGHTELSKLRKTLATYQTKTAAEEKIARDAMKVAASKVQIADMAAARAKRMAEAAESDEPEPVAEEPVETKPLEPKPAQHPKKEQAKPAQQSKPSANTAQAKPGETKPAPKADNTASKP